MKVEIETAVRLFEQFLRTRANSDLDTTREMIKRESPYWIAEHKQLLIEAASKED